MTKSKILTISIAVLAAVIIITLAILLPFVIPFKGKRNPSVWVKTDTFSMEDTFVLEKSSDKDFVVLNLTDIQLNDTLDIGKRDYTEKTIKKLVEENKPDLITLSGDQVWASPFTRGSIKYLINLMDSFGIPWAPVMGNHDGDGNADFEWVADKYLEAEHCLFKKGPNNIGGVGNYVINIKEGNKIVQTIFMLDSGSMRRYSDGSLTYDFIGEEKQSWYLWNIMGLKQANGGATPEHSLIFHIALPEFTTAYKEWVAGGKDPAIGFGDNLEDPCPPPINSGFFDVIRTMGAKNVIVGHDHVNFLSVMYKEVRLTYSLKTGDRCYSKKDVNGGTTLTIKSDGSVITEHKFIII